MAVDRNLELENKLLSNELDIVMNIISKIRMDLELDVILDEIIKTIREKIEIDNCNFAFIDEEGMIKIHRIHQSVAYPYKAPKEYLDRLFSKKWDYKKHNGLISIVAREKREIYYPDLSKAVSSPSAQAHIDIMGMTAWYGLPIVIEEKVLGTMIFINYGKPMNLTEYEKGLIRRRVALVGRALFNVKLYQDNKRKKAELELKNKIIASDLAIAQKIQNNLLPKNKIPFSEINATFSYIPMLQIGGDFYDFIVDPQKRGFGLLITDVSGHGVPAAFITSMIKISFQSEEVLENMKEPDKVLKIINDALLNNTAENFVTACYAYFDLENRIMRFCSGGHTPLIIIEKQNGKIKDLNPKGKFLGILPALDFEVCETLLEKGLRFLFYTDGLIESINEKEKDFEEKLYQILHKNYQETPEKLKDTIIQELKTHSIFPGKDALDDDMAMIIVDYL